PTASYTLSLPDALPIFGLQVHGDAALRQIVAQERRTDEAALRVGHARLGSAPRLAAQRFDLHHVGTEPREQLRRVGQCLHLLERDRKSTRLNSSHEWTS